MAGGAEPLQDSLEHYLALWDLVPEGDPIVTPRARLLPVGWRGKAAMLKLATEPEEAFGGVLMRWWDGEGAARVFAAEDDVILMERAQGTRSLAAYARGGRDDEATRILCGVAARLHAPRAKPLPALVPLPVWFRDLDPVAAAQGGLLARAAAEARALLADPQEVGVLHGDIHHDNILDFGDGDWRAIDPKRLMGERGFDYANIFTNPDLGDLALPPVATLPDRFARRLAIVVERSGLERRRLLRWILAWCGLSAAWFIGDGDDAAVDLQVATMAAAALDA